MNKYKMPVAPFIGVNNHGQSTMFAVGLISDESKETFMWLIQVCYIGDVKLLSSASFDSLIAVVLGDDGWKAPANHTQ